MRTYKEYEGFGISYNPDPSCGLTSWESDFNSDETAIVVQGHYFVLNGNFKSELEELACEGLASCLKFFYDNPQHHSSWNVSKDIRK